MDKQQISEIRARCDAATRGPWEMKLNRHPETTGEHWGWVNGPRENWCWTDKRKGSGDDADFIAHARQDIPALLDEVERLTAELEAADKAMRVRDAIAIAERDAAVKRAEALEWAIKIYAPCLTCIREMPNDKETCGNCQHWLEGPGVDGWQFDEVRFSEVRDTDKK